MLVCAGSAFMVGYDRKERGGRVGVEEDEDIDSEFIYSFRVY